MKIRFTFNPKGSLDSIRNAILQNERDGILDVGYLMHAAKLLRIDGRFSEAMQYVRRAEEAARMSKGTFIRVDSLTRVLGAQAYILYLWSLSIKDDQEKRSQLRSQAKEKIVKALEWAFLVEWDRVDQLNFTDQQSAFFQEMKYQTDMLPLILNGDQQFVAQAIVLILQKIKERASYRVPVVFHLLATLVLSSPNTNTESFKTASRLVMALCFEGVGITVDVDILLGESGVNELIASLPRMCGDRMPVPKQELIIDVIHILYILRRKVAAKRMAEFFFKTFGEGSRFRWVHAELLVRSGLFSEAAGLLDSTGEEKFRDFMVSAGIFLGLAKLKASEPKRNMKAVEETKELVGKALGELRQFREKVPEQSLFSVRYLRYHLIVVFLWEVVNKSSLDQAEIRPLVLRSRQFLSLLQPEDIPHARLRDFSRAKELLSLMV